MGSGCPQCSQRHPWSVSPHSKCQRGGHHQRGRGSWRRSCTARLGCSSDWASRRAARPWDCVMTGLNKSLRRGKQCRVWWTPGSFSIQFPQRSCEAMWRGVWCLWRHLHWLAGAQGTNTVSSCSSGHCHMPIPPGLNSGFPLKLNSCHSGAHGSFANVAA